MKQILIVIALLLMGCRAVETPPQPKSDLRISGTRLAANRVRLVLRNAGTDDITIPGAHASFMHRFQLGDGREYMTPDLQYAITQTAFTYNQVTIIKPGTWITLDIALDDYVEMKHYGRKRNWDTARDQTLTFVMNIGRQEHRCVMGPMRREKSKRCAIGNG